MGCFLVITQKDFSMVEMMNRASKQERPAFEKVQFISKVDNPTTRQQEILVKVDEKLANTLRQMFPDTRQSEQQDSHHIFPQKHRSFFKEANINVDEFAVLLDQRSHLQMHRNREGYNRAWDQFVENYKGSNPTQVKQDAIRYAGQLMTAFGFNDTDISHYRNHSY